MQKDVLLQLSPDRVAMSYLVNESRLVRSAKIEADKYSQKDQGAQRRGSKRRRAPQFPAPALARRGKLWTSTGQIVTAVPSNLWNENPLKTGFSG